MKSRREFLKICGATALLWASGIRLEAKKTLENTKKRVKNRFFPKQIKKIDEIDIIKPGKWRG